MNTKSVKHSFNFAFCRLLMLTLGVWLAGCATSGVNNAINAYQAEAGRIELGQTKEKVLGILQPTQAHLQPRYAKAPEEYMEGNKRKEIYFFRSRSFSDGLVTDDEFTPYIFEDGVLVAIGWTAIGGPKTQAQSRDNDPDYHFHGGFIHYY